MTDNDIIEALGYCFAVGDCEHCVYADKPCQELLADALKLINRLKSEIDILRNSLHVSNQNFENMARAMPNIAKATRIEAIKEFAERLKRDITINNTEDGCLIYSIDYGCLMEDIDNLVKEMTEEQA